MSTLKKVKESVKSMQALFDEKGFATRGQDIKDFIAPSRGRGLAGDGGYEGANTINREFIIDDTAEGALDMLVSGFMSMLVPQTSPWLKLVVADKDLMKNQAVRIHLDQVAELILRIFEGEDVYSVLQNSFTEFCSFSTAAQLIDKHDVNSIVPKSFTFGEYLFKVGMDKAPHTFAHYAYWTAEQLKAEFGEDNLSDKTKKLLDNKGAAPKKIKVWHLIEPADSRGTGVENKQGMPFNSIYYEDGTTATENKFLRVSGYKTFPVQIVRWQSISNDLWGSDSPGERQLANVKMLQRLVEMRLIATELVGDPPLYSDSDTASINKYPGGVTFGNGHGGGKPSVEPLMPQYNPQINAILESEERTRDLIKKGYSSDLFLLHSSNTNDRKTTVEVMALSDEKWAMLGPVLNRVFSELLRPGIGRTYSILSDQGFFHPETGLLPIPPELEGHEIEIDFISVLALAQKAVGLNNIDRFIERIGILAELFGPEATDGVDVDALVDRYGSTIPADILRDVELRIQDRQARAVQQQAEQNIAAMESSAEITEMLGNAQIQGTALEGEV